MKTSFSLKESLKPLKEIKKDSFFRLMQYDELDGTNDKVVNDFINSSKKKLKQIRIVLDDSVIKVREEKILYCKGAIEQVEYIPRSLSFRRKLFSAMDDIYDDIYPSYTGTGEMLLELSFSDFILLELEEEKIIIKEESFWVCEGDIAVEYEEDDDEISLKGSGVVVLELPVSEREVIRCGFNKDSLRLFNDDIILRRGRLEKRIDKNSMSFVGSGEVWLAPTRLIYDRMKIGENME